MSSTMEPAPASTPKPWEEIRKILLRAQKGDASILPALRELLQDPATVNACGDLAQHAERSFVDAAAGKDLAFREGLFRKLELLRAELAGPSPTPVERLLVERVVACWLQVQDADIRYAQSQRECTLRQGEYYQQRMDRAHRRYLSALKTLATVRKLAVPVLQVNIARKQVNVAGAVPLADQPGES